MSNRTMYTLLTLSMRFRFPGSKIDLRICEPVPTTDPQYSIVDVGIQYDNADGTTSIDSLAVGGSFASARRWIDNANSRVDAAQPATVTPTVTVVADSKTAAA